jgi:hypothetical protein
MSLRNPFVTPRSERAIRALVHEETGRKLTEGLESRAKKAEEPRRDLSAEAWTCPCCSFVGRMVKVADEGEPEGDVLHGSEEKA